MKVETSLIEKLKQMTSKNPAAIDVFCYLAMRKRSRSSITLSALVQNMREEGFKHKREEYRAFLDAMAKAGVGTPVYNRLKNCIGLINIKLAFSELGKALLDAVDMVPERAATRNRRLSDKISDSVLPITSIAVAIGNKEAVMSFPQGLTPEELRSLIFKLQGPQA